MNDQRTLGAEDVAPEPPTVQTFITDDEVGRRLRAVAAELRVVSSRRRVAELAGELEQVARLIDPAGDGAA
jgi:hypothetical protein